jgi:uncharacterized protein (DUF2236 family)
VAAGGDFAARPGSASVTGYCSSLFPAPPAAGTPGDAGLFGPGSQVWRVGRERVLLAAGPAALLLQLAHPLVAAGVAEHSDFSGDPMRRLRGTLDATLTVVFGDRQQAHAAAARVGRQHRTVIGRSTVPVGHFPAGTPYRAGDPELARWVHATLVWTALELYDRFVVPLPHVRRAAYLVEMSTFGRLFGVPDRLLFTDYDRFEDYVRGVDADGVLAVGPHARAAAAQILTAGATDLPRPLPSAASRAAGLLAAGLLPPRLRAGYQLPWGPRERAAYTALGRASRTALRALPPQLRFWSHYLVAEQRLRAHQPLATPSPSERS